MSTPRPSAVHQLLAVLRPGDALGDEALAIRRHLRAGGLGSEIFAGWIDPRLDPEARPLGEFSVAGDPAAVCLYHFAPGCRAGPVARAAAGRLVLRYRGLGSPQSLAGWSRSAARLAASAADELRELAPRTALALVDSTSSRDDLVAAGFRAVDLLPCVHETAWSVPASRVFRRLHTHGHARVLSVGRLAPDERVENLLRAFAVLKRRLLPDSSLLLVGDDGIGGYARALHALVRELGLQHVEFCGRLEEDERRAAYELADVYVSLSEREEYAVPLVEAVLARVPVLAREGRAAATVLAGAGILVRDPDPGLVAGLVERLVRDPDLRESVLRGQELVARRIRETDFRALVLQALSPLLEQSR
jgi:glycosyltransferase involved in cell wall biosynthesis